MDADILGNKDDERSIPDDDQGKIKCDENNNYNT